MSDQRRPLIRPGFVLALVALPVAALFLNVIAGVVMAVWFLATGWISELARLANAFHPSLPSLASFVGGLAGFIIGTHLFLRSLRGGRGNWRIRATNASVGLGLLTILAGMALGGTVHQLGWLLGSGQPVLESRWPRRAFFQYREVSSWVQLTISKDPTPETLRDSLSAGAEQKFIERFVMLMFPNETGAVERIAIRFRDGKQFRASGGMVLTRRAATSEFDEKLLTSAEFDALLAALHQ